MPSRRDPNRPELVHDAMARLILDHGVEGLTLRAIAEGTGIAASTLIAQFTHRRRLLAWFTAVTCQRRSRHWDRWKERHGLAGLLPRDDDALETEAIWSALREVGRWRQDLAEVVKDEDAAERGAIGYVLAERDHALGVTVPPGTWWRPDPDEVTLVAAVLAGLRTAMIRTVDPLPLTEAVRLLSRYCGEGATHLLKE